MLVNQTLFFVSNETLKTISEPNKKMRIKCVPQIQIGGAAEAIVASTDSANKGAKGIVVGTFALNLLMSSALNLLWGLINGLQILSLFPLADCDMPGNA